MSEIGDALGTAAEGALLGRAVEPRRGEGESKADPGHTHEQACLNCGTALLGPHCHGCGQRAHVHRTIGAFMHDLLHGALHFEGKTFRTLPLLAWRPGELTRRYIEGERARFVSPMALFLFSVFVMFAVFQLAGITPPDDLGSPVQVNGVEASSTAAAEGQLAGLREARAELGEDNPASPYVDRQIETLERQIAEAAEEDGAEQSPAPAEGAEAEEEQASPQDATIAESEASAQASTGRTGWAPLDNLIGKWRANPGLMAYKLQANSYKFSWLLIPLSVPFVWLIFAWRRKFGAYDHAVFVTYSLCFMSLLFVAIAALGQIPWVSGGLLFFALVLIPPVHIYKQLRGAYGLSRFSALWRMIVLMVFITIILLLFLYLLLALGAA